MSNRFLLRVTIVFVLGWTLGVLPRAYGQAAAAAATGGATDAVATVLAVRGNVAAIDPAGKSRQLALKAELFRGDTIKSGDRGRVQIGFRDETLISLGANTEMTIERFDFRPNQNDGELVTHVREGAFRVMGGAIAKIAPSKFKTETPTATIGIRGSFYAGNVAALQLTAIFLGGRGIMVFNAAGFVEITRPSFGTTVPNPNAPPETPRRFSAAEIGQLLAGFAFSGLGGDVAPGTGGGEQGAGPGDGGGTGAGGDSGAGGGDAGGDTGGSGSGDGAGTSENPQLYESLQKNSENPPGNPPPSNPPPEDPPPAPTTLSLNGHFLNLYAPAVRGGGTESHRGTVSGSSVGGTVSGALAQSTDGSGFGFNLNLALAAPNPGGVYDPALAGSGADPVGHAVVLTNPAVPSFDSPYTYKYDNLGEFAAFRSQGLRTLTNDNYTEIGFLGSPSLTLPAGAIAHYEGVGLAVQQALTGGATAAFSNQNAFVAVNFYNHTILGGFYQPATTGGATAGAFGPQNLFFFGKLDGLALTDTQVFGVGSTGSASVFQGALDTGTFFGSAHQGFGLTGTGDLFDLGNGFQTGTFDLAMAALKQQESILVPTDESNWSGFAVGAVPTATDTPRLYGAGATDGLTLDFDRRAGTVTGALNVTNGGATLNATVGAEGSAYVDDYRFISTLADAGTGPGGRTDTSAPGASLLVTDPSAGNQSEWYSWGYWSLSHTDTEVRTNSFHIPLLSGLWVAGERTDPDHVKGLMNTSTAVGVYRGEARGLEARPGGILNTLLGTSAVNVFFGTRDVQGSFVFPTVSMQTAGTIASDGSGFAGSVTAVNRPADPATLNTGSSFQGTFLGPQANAVAGSLGASLSDGSVYKAVYAGDRQ